MEDSSDMLNSAGNSNLRDLIMQKLSAAREQKLKQNRSTNNLLKSSKNDLSSASLWEDEKKMMNSLIEKSQNLVVQLNEDKKNLEVINEELAEKVKILEMENKELKIDLEKNRREKNEKGFNEEVKKLENAFNEKEKRFREEVKKNFALEEKVNELNEALREKEKEIEKFKKSGRNSRGFNERIAQNLADFKAEKDKIDRLIERNLTKEGIDEIMKLKSVISQLKESKEMKEKDLKEQIALILQENQSLKKKLETEKKDESDTTKSDTQKSYETLHSLESSLEKLKDDPKDSKSLLPSVQKDYSDFYNRQKSVDDLHFSELIQKNAEISSFLNEISELRHKLVVFESKKYENELRLVRSDLHKAIAERMHAKKLIICYIRNVQQLEKIINDRIGPDEVNQLAKLENLRLHEENNSLVESLAKKEEFHVNEIRNLQENIDSLHGKIRELEGKIDLLAKGRIKDANDDMKSWIVRNRQLQEINKKLVECCPSVDVKPQQVNKKRGNGKETVKIH
jgi:hypothetical protein